MFIITSSVSQSAGYRLRFPTKRVDSPLVFYFPPTIEFFQVHTNNNIIIMHIPVQRNVTLLNLSWQSLWVFIIQQPSLSP